MLARLAPLVLLLLLAAARPAAAQPGPELSPAARTLIPYALTPPDLPREVRLTSGPVEITNEATAASDPDSAAQIYRFGRLSEIVQRLSGADLPGSITAGLTLFRDGDGAWEDALATTFGAADPVEQVEAVPEVGERSVLYRAVRGIAPNRTETYRLLAQRNRVQIAVSVTGPAGAVSLDQILPLARTIDGKIAAAPPGPVSAAEQAALEEPTPAVLVRGAVRLLRAEFYQPVAVDSLLTEAWQGAARALERAGLTGIPPPPAYPAEEQAAIALHMQAFPRLERLAEGRLSGQDLAYAAIAELVERRDDCHTSHLNRTRWEIFKARQRGEPAVQIGVGFSVEKPLTVVTVLPNSPAERAGLRAGQEVIAINGIDLRGYTITEARSLIDPRAGVPSTFTVRNPDGSLRRITAAPKAFALPPLESRILPDGFGLLSFYTFQAGGDQLERIRATLTEWEAQGVPGWIIDLRRNGGGSAALMTAIASLFVEGGRLYAHVARDGQPRYVSATRGLTLPFQRPLVFLVGPGSASASEILAGSLQARGRAVVVGDVTAGCIGSFIPRGLLDGSAFNPTTTEILIGPDGARLHRQGVTPNVFAPITPQDSVAGRDPGVTAAVAVLRETSGHSQPATEKPAPPEQQAIVTGF